MDLSTLDTMAAASEGAVMEVRHPVTGMPLKSEGGEPITLTLLGYDSKQFQEYGRLEINRRLNGGAPKVQTAEGYENDKIEALSVCVKAWANIMLDGKVLDCSPANAKAVLARFPWIREQVDVFVGSRANFLPASRKS